MYDWRRTAPRRDDEGLDAEATYEIGDSIASLVCGQVTLVPGKTKGRIRQLDYEGVEFSLRRQTANFHVHDFDVTQ
jgi:hypothetical protein